MGTQQAEHAGATTECNSRRGTHRHPKATQRIVYHLPAPAQRWQQAQQAGRRAYATSLVGHATALQPARGLRGLALRQCQAKCTCAYARAHTHTHSATRDTRLLLSP